MLNDNFLSKRTLPLYVGCSLLAIAVPATAQAQAAGATPATASNAQPQSAAGDIIVTATRRSERLQNVPIAVSAIDEAQIQARKIDNFADIVKIAPGPTFIPVKGTSVISVQIRGKSSTNDATGLENPIGVYIDDIYYGSLASFDSNLFDVSQIAVLRGPQGTTFGRSAVGGALQITDNVAKLNETSGRFTLTGLAFQGGALGIESDGYVNLPVANNAAFRLAYSIKSDDGYQHNLVTGHNLADNRVASVRGSFTYQPSEALRILASASYTSRTGRGDGPTIIGNGSLAALVATQSGGNLHNVMLDDDGDTMRRIFAGLLRVELQTGIGQITSITGYRSLKARLLEDADGGPLAVNVPSINTNDEKQFSEELRFTSDWGGPLSLLAGVYYGHEKLNHGITFNFDGRIAQSYLSVLTGGTLATQTVIGDISNDSVGPYIEGKFKITPQLSFTAGLRYSYEHKTGYTQHIGTSPFYGGPYYQTLPGPLDNTDHWDAFTPRFIAEYKPSNDILFYASASRGFQGGGWVLTAKTAAAAQIPLTAETTWSYEIGTKSTLFNRLLTVNLAAFIADTTNLQVRSLVNGVLTDSNAGKERVKGIEAEITLRPAEGLSLGVNYAYTDAFYSDFAGCAAGNFSCTGKQVPFTPKNDFTALIDYQYKMSSGAAFDFHFDTKFADSYQLVPTNAQQLAVPLTARRNVANISLSYTAPNGQWDVRLWSHNLFNKTYITNGLAYNFYHVTPAEVAAAGGLGNLDVERVTVAPPRSVGLTFSYHFGN